MSELALPLSFGNSLCGSLIRLCVARLSGGLRWLILFHLHHLVSFSTPRASPLSNLIPSSLQFLLLLMWIVSNLFFQVILINHLFNQSVKGFARVFGHMPTLWQLAIDLGQFSEAYLV